MPASYTPDLPAAPAVSVIIPAFRCAETIGEALDAALAQTYRDREVIVVNDGCPDTKALESVLTRYRDHILYMRRPHGGPSAARNAAMEFSRGRYLAFLDSDDLWAPGFLARLVPMLDGDRTLDAVYCDARIVGEGFDGTRFMQAFPSRGAVTFERMLEGECAVFNAGALVRASRVREIDGFDESLGIAEDLDLWLRLLLDHASIKYITDPLVCGRLLPTRLCADVERAERAALQVLEKLGARRDLSPVRRTALRTAKLRLLKAAGRRA